MTLLLRPLVLVLAVCAASLARADVVLDQISPASTYPRGASSKSGNFLEPQYNFFSAGVVDDFTVTATTLDLTNVSAVLSAQGGTFTTFSAIPGWEVAIYSSLAAAQGSLTGDVADVVVPAANATITTGFNQNGDNNALLSLPINLVLPKAGTYYLGVMSRNPLDTTGWVNVYDFGSAGGGNAFSQTPGATNGVTSTALGADAAYRLVGQAAAVPEPSTWALLSVGAGLLGAGVVRRRPSHL